MNRAATITICATRMVRLYEQAAGIDRIGTYVTRWLRRLKAEVGQVDEVVSVLPHLRDAMIGTKHRPGLHSQDGGAIWYLVLTLARCFAAEDNHTEKTDSQ